MPLALRLPCDGVHDGVLRVHADGRVVLGVDDGGLAAGPLHLDGLMGGEGGVQSAGAEAGAVVGRVMRERKEGESVREGAGLVLKRPVMLTANSQSDPRSNFILMQQPTRIME